MKSRPPARRPKTRYLRLRIEAEEEISFDEFSDSVNSALEDSLGHIYGSRVHLRILHNTWKKERQSGIIEVRKESVDEVRASLITADLPVDGFIYIEKASGTVSSLT